MEEFFKRIVSPSVADILDTMEYQYAPASESDRTDDRKYIESKNPADDKFRDKTIQAQYILGQ